MVVYMVNRELKKKVLEMGLDKIQASISLQKYKAKNEQELDNAFEREAFFLQEPIREYYETAERLNKAKYERVKRLKKRITKMLAYDCLFLTLTFSDQKIDLESTKQETRRKYVQRFLNDLRVNYVANIDFGEKNGREHYHALVCKSKIDPSLWSYGALNIKRVITSDQDTNKRLAKYIAKLTNHAIKESVGNTRILYSRLDYLKSDVI